MNSDRIGRFVISDVVMCAVSRGLDCKTAKGMMALFGQMIVIRASDAPHNATTEYVAVSKLFEPLEEFKPIPVYNISWVVDDDGNVELKAEKQEPQPPMYANAW